MTSPDGAPSGHPPRLTVLTTVFNGEKHVDEAVASVVGQEFEDLEYVIVDDGSTDATPAILERWVALDPRIRVLRNESNRGIPASANRGLEAARGEYVARLDADDVSLPGRFTRQMAYLDEHPEVVLVTMNYLMMTEDGVILRRTDHAMPSAAIEFFLKFSNAVAGHSQVMYRRGPVLAIGGYDTRFRFSCDYDLWTRLVRRGRMVFLPGVAMRYRLRNLGVTGTFRDEQLALSKSIARRELETLLERTLDEAELRAVEQTVRATTPAADPLLADRVFTEAFGIFCGRTGDESLRCAVREGFARKHATAGLMVARTGDVVNAARHFQLSARWHIRSSLHTLGRIARVWAMEHWLRRFGRKAAPVPWTRRGVQAPKSRTPRD